MAYTDENGGVNIEKPLSQKIAKLSGTCMKNWH
jgi:hypothetical protein